MQKHSLQIYKNKNKAMKKILFLIFGLICLCSSIYAQTPRYGITVDGDIFVEEALADECGANSNIIEVQGSFNDWQMQNMVLVDKDHDLNTTTDGYYVLRTGNKYKPSAKIEISIRIGEQWFPECVKDKVNSGDLKSNGNNGTNLYLKPTSDISFD